MGLKDSLRTMRDKEMEYIQRHIGLNIFNYDFIDEYANPKKHVECFFDPERAMHYVLHNGKRVYYSKTHSKDDVIRVYNSIYSNAEKSGQSRLMLRLRLTIMCTSYESLCLTRTRDSIAH